MAAPVGTGRALGVAMSVMEFDQISMTGTGSKAGFFGVSATTQPANAAQAALTLTTSLQSGFGFTTSAGFNAFIAQLENMRASLVTLGLMKGGA
jgi:hypothetical protein